ncbi:MAG: 16S rRNA (adenine(1518)-N(6)/adenine(1519)-N(6))-dimethyltransferase RsmA [Candidatus Izimaplasma sp.]|nr:16S rRNA (adenine(1518)-N(6)/adenine(1519)-N(6))-dimethyltransferase RsmA [Candidatus Izimaplasma bacterium]
MTKIGTITHIKETLKKHNIKIKKKFGQNFLTDLNILKKIAHLPDVTDKSLIIEIGPGLGGLTKQLLDTGATVLGYEIDNDLVPILKETFKADAFSLIHGDFLERNIDQDVKALNKEFDKVVVVANLPYYITTPIVFKILEESSIIKETYMMMQLEVAKRFTGKPSTKDYNALSVTIQYKTDTNIAMTVPKTVFIPQPRVDSAVIQMIIRENKKHTPNNENIFFKILKSSFRQRRKTLANNLSNTLNLDKSAIKEHLQNLGLKPNIRAEKLSVKDFVHLSDELEHLIS